jgi:hypothetical protein
MNGLEFNSLEGTHYALHFQSLFDPGRGYAFPCDAEGQVDIDALSQTARDNYFYARIVVGRELSVPAVRVDATH